MLHNASPGAVHVSSDSAAVDSPAATVVAQPSIELYAALAPGAVHVVTRPSIVPRLVMGSANPGPTATDIMRRNAMAAAEAAAAQAEVNSKYRAEQRQLSEMTAQLRVSESKAQKRVPAGFLQDLDHDKRERLKAFRQGIPSRRRATPAASSRRFASSSSVPPASSASTSNTQPVTEEARHPQGSESHSEQLAARPSLRLKQAAVEQAIRSGATKAAASSRRDAQSCRPSNRVAGAVPTGSSFRAASGAPKVAHNHMRARTDRSQSVRV